MNAVTTAAMDGLVTSRRAEEGRGRERRRQLRNSYQEQIKQAYNSRAYETFADDAQQNIHRRSFIEDALMNTMRRTASWWGDICDRAIMRELMVEKTLKSRAQNEETYYNLTKKREAVEQMNVEESDHTRWETINAEHARRSAQDRDKAVQSVLQHLWSETAEMAAELEKYGLCNPKNSLLAMFAMRQHRAATVAVARSAVSGTPVHSPTTYLPAAAREIFCFLFHTPNPFQLSSAEFLSFLKMLYDQADMPVNIANVLKISPIPIFVLEGPKYSGKTLLTEHLCKTYRLLCISDINLVERAMKAADANLSTGGAEKAVEEECIVDEEVVEAPPATAPQPSDRWATYGKDIRQQLRCGGAIGLEVIVKLFYLQLEELHQSNEERYEAILLEGVLKTVEAYKEINRQFHRIIEHPWKLLFREWCASTCGRGDVNGEEDRDGHHTDAALSLADLDVCTPEVLVDAKTRRISPPFRVPLHPIDEGSAKVESRSRPAKKADIASLPPPDLPEVEDVRDSIKKEQGFITNAVKELSSLPSVLSGVLYIQCDPEEIFRRFAGLREDTGTGTIYHMLYNPPPKERLPFLVNMDRTNVSSVELVDVVFHHIAQWAAVQRWLQRQQSPSFSRIYELPGNGPVEGAHGEAVELMGRVLGNFTVSRELYQQLSASEESLSELLAQWRRQVAVREAERVRLASLYLEKGAPLPPPLERTTDGVSTAIYPTPQGMPDIVFRVLNELTVDYVETYNTVWGNLGQLVHLLLQYYRSAEDRLQEFWKRPDDKETILHRFQHQFNQLPKSLRSHVGCKEELHVCLVELRDALYHSIATKKEESYQYMNVMVGREACLEGWEGWVRQEGMTLLQCETERYLMIVNMYLLFFSSTSDAPFLFEDVEVEMPVMTKGPSDRMGTVSSLNDAASSVLKGSKERKSTTSKRTHGKSPDEQMEKSAEDVFIGAVQAVSASLTGMVERFFTKRHDDFVSLKVSSFLLPGRSFTMDIKDPEGSLTIFKDDTVAGFQADDYVTEQQFYESADGTRIPMFILYKKGCVSTTSPVLLYGYGGFNISLTPSFSPSRIVFLQNLGGVVAIPNIRGGGEYGQEWHDAGRRGQKQNCFTDFIEAAKYLHKSGIGSPATTAIMGGSNGGLLVGASANLAPSQFACVVCQVGVLDMYKFHKFTIGHAWISDYGNPDKAEDFAVVEKYSPIHNVRSEVQYPAILVVTADHDDRVVPLHSLKYVATLQHANPELGGPFLARVEVAAGHGAGKPTSKIVEETSDMYAFMAKNIGATWHD